MAATATREEIEGRVFEALEEFGAEPDQINPDADLRVARHRLARPRRARADRRGRVRRAAQGRGHGGRQDRPSGRGPGGVEAGMTRVVVITGVGAVTPLGVGARTLHERWSAGAVRDRGRLRPRERVRAQGAPLHQGGAPLGPLHPARARGCRRGDRGRRLGRRPALRPGPRGLRDRHRDRRHRHARGEPHHPAATRAPSASRRSRSRC